MKILSNFDRGITEILADKVKANLSFKVRFLLPPFPLTYLPGPLSQDQTEKRGDGLIAPGSSAVVYMFLGPLGYLSFL